MKALIQILLIISLMAFAYSIEEISLALEMLLSNDTFLETFENYIYDESVLFFNKFCTIFKPLGENIPSFLTVNPSEINFVLLTKTQELKVPILQVKKLFINEMFTKQWPTVLFVGGFGADYIIFPSLLRRSIASAYINRSNVNYIVLDTGHYVDPLYNWAVYNAEIISKLVGTALTEVNDFYPAKNIHLIGLSLGAQIVGGIGRIYHNITGTLMSHITGLDPARPCFRYTDPTEKLSKNDAEFVDVIHTNYGILGNETPMGHIDFYVNGIVEIQPGCTHDIIGLFCSHSRCVDLYAESVMSGYEKNFVSLKCEDFQELAQRNCSGSSVYMGYLVPHDARGIYYVPTKESYPYGKS